MKIAIKHRKNLKLIGGVSATLLSFAFGNFVAKAGPVRPTLKSVVFKMVGGSQVTPYDLNSEQRKLWKTTGSSRISRSPSPSGINPNDGQLPSTSSSGLKITKMERSLSLSSISSEEGSVITGASGPSPSQKINPELHLEMISKSGFDYSSVVRGTANDGSIFSRRNGTPETFVPGESVYKPVHLGEGGIMHGPQGVRPHLILDTKPSKHLPDHTEVTIAYMSRVEGREKKLVYSSNYLIDTSDPSFTGRYATFVKLDRVDRIILPNGFRHKLLGKIINGKDLKNIRTLLGIE